MASGGASSSRASCSSGDDLLLLDEPTNHLDVDAKDWLMKFLRTFRGALLVISHDLALLDQAITRILHLDEGELIEYKGTYSQYLVARKADEERRGKLAARQESEIKRLKSLADVMRHQTAEPGPHRQGARHACRAHAHAAGAGARRRERTLKVKLPEPPRAGKIVLEVEDLAKAFGPKVVFEDVTFDVGRGERLLVLGLNGAGKTTLLRSLVGEIEPELGEVRLGHQVSMGYYAQEHEGITARPHRASSTCASSPASPTSTCAACSACSGCAATSCSRTPARSRAARRRSSRSRCSSPSAHNLLLLDEPTNNLDPPSRTVGRHRARASGRARWCS